MLPVDGIVCFLIYGFVIKRPSAWWRENAYESVVVNKNVYCKILTTDTRRRIHHLSATKLLSSLDNVPHSAKRSCGASPTQSGIMVQRRKFIYNAEVLALNFQVFPKHLPEIKGHLLVSVERRVIQVMQQGLNTRRRYCPY